MRTIYEPVFGSEITCTTLVLDQEKSFGGKTCLNNYNDNSKKMKEKPQKPCSPNKAKGDTHYSHDSAQVVSQDVQIVSWIYDSHCANFQTKV